VNKNENDNLKEDTRGQGHFKKEPKMYFFYRIKFRTQELVYRGV